MWRSGLMRQSSIPEVVGLSPAGGKKLAVGQLSQVGFVRGLYPWSHISPHPGDKLGTWRQCGLYK